MVVPPTRIVARPLRGWVADSAFCSGAADEASPHCANNCAELAQNLEQRAAEDPEFYYFGMLDVFEEFEGEAYVDYCHLTLEGNEHLAERLAEFILAHPGLTGGAHPPAPRPYPAQQADSGDQAANLEP